MAAFKLHNFVINADNLDFCNEMNRNSLGIPPYPITNINDSDGVKGYPPTFNEFVPQEETEARKSYMVDELESMGFLRPNYNLQRND